MRAVVRLKSILLIVIVMVCSLAWAGTCLDAVLGQVAKEIKNGTSTSQDLDTLIAYTKNLDPASDAAKGVVSAISSRAAQSDGASRAAQIISNFPGAQDGIFSSLEPFRSKPGFSNLVVGLGNSSIDVAFGSSEELRFATSRLGADNVNSFQVPLEGTVPDIMDSSHNLYEIKARNYAGQSDFIIGEDLDKIHDQAALALSQLSPGATLTLAFNQPLTVSAEALYQQKFADLIANPNLIRINGF